MNYHCHVPAEEPEEAGRSYTHYEAETPEIAAAKYAWLSAKRFGSQAMTVRVAWPGNVLDVDVRLKGLRILSLVAASECEPGPCTGCGETGPCKKGCVVAARHGGVTM